MADHLSRTIKSAVRRIAGSNKRFGPFFSWAADQPEGTRETELDTIESQVGLSRLQAVALCKQLQEATVGRFVAGRRGRPSRLEWNLDPRAVGAVIVQAEGDAQVDETDGGDGDDAPAPSRGNSRSRQQHDAAPAPAPAAQTAEREDEDRYSFRLRSDRQVHVSLPIDLTQREAARLAEFVRALGLPEDHDGAAFGLE